VEESYSERHVCNGSQQALPPSLPPSLPPFLPSSPDINRCSHTREVKVIEFHPSLPPSLLPSLLPCSTGLPPSSCPFPPSLLPSLLPATGATFPLVLLLRVVNGFSFHFSGGGLEGGREGGKREGGRGRVRREVGRYWRPLYGLGGLDTVEGREGGREGGRKEEDVPVLQWRLRRPRAGGGRGGGEGWREGGCRYPLVCGEREKEGVRKEG